MGRFVVRISKEYLKFSSAHFTIFSDAQVEKLHGHNYYVGIEVESRDDGSNLVVDFHQVKQILRRICESLDERVLLPMDSPLVKIAKHEQQFRVVFQGAGFRKEYGFPCEEVVLLPLSNITAEGLAKHICEECVQSFREEAPNLTDVLVSVSLTVEETRGQGVSYIWEN